MLGGVIQYQNIEYHWQDTIEENLFALKNVSTSYVLQNDALDIYTARHYQRP